VKDSNDPHVPSDEFVEYLARDLVRTMRHDARFGAARSPARPRRLAMAVGIAAGVVLTLATGIVLGASARYASAAGIDSTRTGLRFLPIKTALNALGCGQSIVTVPLPKSAPLIRQAAQPGTPTVDLTSPSARTEIALTAVQGVRETPDGRLLVNDAGRRQLHLFDASLTTSTVLIDRSATRNRAPFSELVAFVGDSSLFGDPLLTPLDGMLILDGQGKTAHSIPTPPFITTKAARVDWLSRKPGQLATDTPVTASGIRGVDAKGRLVYAAQQADGMLGYTTRSIVSKRTVLQPKDTGSRADALRQLSSLAEIHGVMSGVEGVADTVPIRAFDPVTRVVDTLAYVMQPPNVLQLPLTNASSKVIPVEAKDGKPRGATYQVNPLRSMDEWAVLSDGTIGIVRGADYHVDWIRPDGTRASSPKLPFTWTPLGDVEKQRLVDSARVALDSAVLRDRGRLSSFDDSALLNARASFRFQTDSTGAQRRVQRARGQVSPPTDDAFRYATWLRANQYQMAPLSEIADHYPPISRGAVLADRDGNLWILPNVAAQVKDGPRVYDVVNPARGLVRRVRIPAGRTIVGFGPQGVVYLSAGGANGIVIERTTVPSR